MTIDGIERRRAAMIMGALILMAFGTWGGGGALLDAGTAMALPVMFASAPVVILIGLLAFGVMRAVAPVVAATYLATRLFEAALLTVAAVLMTTPADALFSHALFDAGQRAYLAAMAGLGIGSIPFCLALLHHRMVPFWLGLWGAVGYAIFAIGMIADMTELGIGLMLLVPGGVFEIVFALWLIIRGLASPAASPARPPLVRRWRHTMRRSLALSPSDPCGKRPGCSTATARWR
ncbi:MAG: DUF4386 domain-containing protein [Pararhodobacter sp.]